MRKFAVALLGLSALSVGTANAADLSTKAPIVRAPVFAPYNWTGLYVGINGNEGWGHTDWT